jgi:hypothetical protein
MEATDINTLIGELPDPGEVPRYSSRALPVYRYVPGVHPHPTRHPSGHSYGAGSSRADARAAAVDHPDWRFGVDLFNRFFFWEAHEAWEELWRRAAPDCVERLLLQGLIQLAAALLKVHTGALRAAQRLSRESLAKLARVADRQARVLGLDVGAVHAAFADFLRPLRDDQLPRLDASVPRLWLA